MNNPTSLNAANPWTGLAVISLALLPIGIDMTVLNVALPRLTTELGATNADKLWMVNTYSLVMAGLLPGFGALSDRIGHRTLLLIGLALFSIASLAAAFAPTTNLLIMLRGALAIGAAMILPATISIVRLIFAEDNQRATAIGIWGGVWSGCAALGPIVGGLLLNHFWWGSVFLINLPIALLTMVLTLTKIPHLPANKDRHWDLLTSLYLMISLIGLLFAIKGALKAEAIWNHVAVAFALGCLFGFLFLRRQARVPSPLVDFTLFRNARFSAGACIAVLATFALMGMQYVVSQELQLVRGFSPLNAGIYLLPIAIASFFSGLGAGRVMMSFGIERMMIATCALGVSGTVLYCFGGHMSLPWLELTTLALIGFAAGGAMATASTAIMISAPNDKAGMAGAIESIAYELGGTLGVAVMGSVVGHIYSSTLSATALPVLPRAAQKSMEEVIGAAAHLPPDAGRVLITTAKAAYLNGVNASLALAAVVMAVLLLIVAIVKGNRKGVV
ncbi:MFS transporter [uncultured Cohaesibacter sp.]|uniref:MFS transporter n=1 Tax=uncultured Cohaesibacter sp. TaxID=1002546 RepID=UPI00292F2762|nr:MFS transporter [uncultured Cohaesibacter sp.]